MIDTIEDKVVRTILEGQLRAANYSWINLVPLTDYKIQSYQFAVFSAMVFKDGVMFDTWLIVGGGSSGRYSAENYPKIEDAISQHVGRLALDGMLKIVDMTNALTSKKRSRKRSKSDKPDV